MSYCNCYLRYSWSFNNIPNPLVKDCSIFLCSARQAGILSDIYLYCCYLIYSVGYSLIYTQFWLYSLLRVSIKKLVILEAGYIEKKKREEQEKQSHKEKYITMFTSVSLFTWLGAYCICYTFTSKLSLRKKMKKNGKIMSYYLNRSWKNYYMRNIIITYIYL